MQTVKLRNNLCRNKKKKARLQKNAIGFLIGFCLRMETQNGNTAVHVEMKELVICNNRKGSPQLKPWGVTSLNLKITCRRVQILRSSVLNSFGAPTQFLKKNVRPTVLSRLQPRIQVCICLNSVATRKFDPWMNLEKWSR